MPEPVAQRIIPGAPPPAPLSKNQKRKRKAKGSGGDAAAAPDTPSVIVSEKTPEPAEVQESTSTPAPDSLIRSDSHATPLPEEDLLLKPSPIVDLVHKRLKATTKKISRITIYAATDPEKLNDDQKRTLKTLPTLEAIQKELGEVKKAIEVHESELVQELAIKRAEAEKAEKARIADAVATSQSAIVGKIHGMLDLLRLRSSLASGLLDISSIADAAEAAALCSAADAVISEDDERKQAAVTGLLFGGDSDGVAYSRILEITQLAFIPPRVPTPQQEEEVVEEEQPVLAASVVETEPEVPVVGITASTISSSLRFIQDSEIEAPSFEESAEWIERSDAVGHEEELAINGLATEAAPVDAANGPIDWAADDEGGLPSIAGLHAEFGTSGSATPAEAVEPQGDAVAPIVDGVVDSQEATPENDGFTQTRGRGRGHGPFRGERGRGGRRGERGGFRGGERGGFRGGERGGFRGGERGGERGGFRGGFRGGEHGGFRGGERGRGAGEWRGGERGGRGRGRGGPPAAAAPPVAN